MSVNADKLVQIVPRIIEGGTTGLSFSGLLLTKNSLPPAGRVLRFASAQAVGAYFGTDSLEYDLAQTYFSGYSNTTNLPEHLFFAPFTDTDVAAWLRSAENDKSLSQLKALQPGGMTLVIDGEKYILTDINLSYATSFSDIAQMIDHAIRPAPTTPAQPAVLTGSEVKLAQLKQVQVKDFGIMVDGQSYEFKDVDLGTELTVQGIAEKLNSLITGATVAVDSKGTGLTITTEAVGDAASLSYGVAVAAPTPATPSVLTGGSLADKGEDIAKITNGTLKITIGGQPYAVRGVDMSNGESRLDLARQLQEQIPAGTVEYNEARQRLAITTSSAPSSIGYAESIDDLAPATHGKLEGGLCVPGDLQNITVADFAISIDGVRQEIRNWNISETKELDITKLSEALGQKIQGVDVTTKGNTLVLTSQTEGRHSSVGYATNVTTPTPATPSVLTGGAVEEGETFTTQGETVKAYMTSGVFADIDYTALKAVTNGCFDIVIDGESKEVRTLSLASVTNLTTLVTELNNAMKAYATVTAGADGYSFIIESLTEGSTSEVGYATTPAEVTEGATDISSLIRLTEPTGAVATPWNVATMQTNTNGSFKITIGDNTQTFQHLDLSSVRTLSDISEFLNREFSSSATVKLTGEMTGLVVTSVAGVKMGYFEKRVEELDLASAGQLVSGAFGEGYADLKAITNGAFDIDVDGKTVAVTAVNLSTVTDIDTLVTALGTKVTGATISKVQGGEDDRFQIVSNTTGKASSISFARTPASLGNATDISGLLKLTFETGGEVTPGYDNETDLAALLMLNQEGAVSLSQGTPAGTDISGLLGLTIATGAVAERGDDAETDISATLMLTEGTAVSLVQGTPEGIDISGFLGLTAIDGATLVQGKDAVYPPYPRVTYSSQTKAWQITSATTGPESTIEYAAPPESGTDLATALGFTQQAGAVISDGMAAQSLTDCMTNVLNYARDWVTFGTIFDAGLEGKIELAKWCSSWDTRFCFVNWEDANAAKNMGDTSTSGAQIANVLQYDGTCSVFNTPQLMAFVMGTTACINFNELNGRLTYAFRQGEGLAVTCDRDEDYDSLTENGYNVYADFATAASNFNFFQPGQVSGKWAWMDTYINAIALKDGLQLNLLDLFKAAKSVPYNDEGYGMVRTACLDTISRFLNFGAIRVGVKLSNTQKVQLKAEIGEDVSQTLESIGWYMQVKDPGSVVRAARGTPDCKFYYMDGGSIQKIVLPATAIQ